MKDLRYMNICLIIAAYIIWYVIWLIAGGFDPEASLVQFIRMRASRFYLFPWLVRNHLYWCSLIIAAGAALAGKRYLSWTVCIGSLEGILIGELLGPAPADPTGHTHHGWYIWILIVLGSVIVGWIIEAYMKKRNTNI